jgi:hypothetical protein
VSAAIAKLVIHKLTSSVKGLHYDSTERREAIETAHSAKAVTMGRGPSKLIVEQSELGPIFASDIFPNSIILPLGI